MQFRCKWFSINANHPPRNAAFRSMRPWRVDRSASIEFDRRSTLCLSRALSHVDELPAILYEYSRPADWIRCELEWVFRDYRGNQKKRKLRSVWWIVKCHDESGNCQLSTGAIFCSSKPPSLHGWHARHPLKHVRILAACCRQSTCQISVVWHKLWGFPIIEDGSRR